VPYYTEYAQKFKNVIKAIEIEKSMLYNKVDFFAKGVDLYE